MRKERIFVTQKIDKASGQILRTVYPTYEVYKQEIKHINSSEVESHESKNDLQHNNEIISYLGDIKLIN